MILFSVNGSGHVFTHDADIGIIGRGVSVESSFEEIAHEIKGVMLERLSVAKIDHRWEARCVVDV